MPKTMYLYIRQIYWLGGQLTVCNCRVLGCVLCNKTGVTKTMFFSNLDVVSSPYCLGHWPQCAVLGFSSTFSASWVKEVKLTNYVAWQMSALRALYFWSVERKGSWKEKQFFFKECLHISEETFHHSLNKQININMKKSVKELSTEIMSTNLNLSPKQYISLLKN